MFAPYDEFARGVKLALNDLGRSDKVKVYSADVSTADVHEITEQNSPWVATVATNPAVVGAASIRAAALLVAGQDPGHSIIVEPVLLTQKSCATPASRPSRSCRSRCPPSASRTPRRPAGFPSDRKISMTMRMS